MILLVKLLALIQKDVVVYLDYCITKESYRVKLKLAMLEKVRI
jgi:hypothetical protein